jgi:hypothetical protein
MENYNVVLVGNNYSLSLIVTIDLSFGTSFIFTAILKKCVIFFIFIFTFNIMHFFFSNFQQPGNFSNLKNMSFSSSLFKGLLYVLS